MRSVLEAAHQSCPRQPSGPNHLRISKVQTPATLRLYVAVMGMAAPIRLPARPGSTSEPSRKLVPVSCISGCFNYDVIMWTLRLILILASSQWCPNSIIGSPRMFQTRFLTSGAVSSLSLLYECRWCSFGSCSRTYLPSSLMVEPLNNLYTSATASYFGLPINRRHSQDEDDSFPYFGQLHNPHFRRG